MKIEILVSLILAMPKYYFRQVKFNWKFVRLPIFERYLSLSSPAYELECFSKNIRNNIQVVHALSCKRSCFIRAATFFSNQIP